MIPGDEGLSLVPRWNAIMPLSPRLIVASQSFNMNSSILKQSVAGLTDDEWLKRPCDHSNNMQWIVGHVTWARAMVLARLGDKGLLPWVPQYPGRQKARRV